MNYSIEKISTVAICDTLLGLAQKEKEDVERRRRNMTESIGSFDERTQQISNELVSVESRLQTFGTLLDTLPEGKDKLNVDFEVKKLAARKAQLKKMVVSYNVSSLLGKQVDVNLLDSQVPVIDAYITAVQNKRTALGGAA